MTHPTKDWEFDDTIEEEFQKWFNEDSWMEICGGFSFRSEWFYEDCEVGDVKTRQNILTKWLHSAFVVGYNAGRCSKTDELETIAKEFDV